MDCSPNLMARGKSGLIGAGETLLLSLGPFPVRAVPQELVLVLGGGGSAVVDLSAGWVGAGVEDLGQFVGVAPLFPGAYSALGSMAAMTIEYTVNSAGGWRFPAQPPRVLSGPAWLLVALKNKSAPDVFVFASATCWVPLAGDLA